MVIWSMFIFNQMALSPEVYLILLDSVSWPICSEEPPNPYAT